MRTVSDGAEDLLAKLVAWELLGRDDFDPKDLLRKVPLPDLILVQTNINDQSDEVKEFVCVRMLEAELLFRSGFLTTDWSFYRCGTCVNICYDTKGRTPQHQFFDAHA